MTRNDISKAVGELSDRYLTEALNGMPGLVAGDPGEVMKMKTAKHSHLRKAIGIAVAACLVLGLSVGAYAANVFGLRDMLSRQGVEVPEAAAEDIVEHGTDESVSSCGWKASLRESLYEGGNAIVTVSVTSDGQYLLAPTDGDPDCMYKDGITYGEYASENGKTLLYVGAKLRDDNGNISGASQDFEQISDGEMNILVYASTTEVSEKIETACIVYALEDGREDVQRVEIPFTLVQGSSTNQMRYTPENPDVIDSIRFGDAELTYSPLGLEVLIALEGPGVEEIGRITCDELPDVNGGLVLGEDGVWRLHWFRGSGEIGESFTLTLCREDGSLMGNAVFRK